MIIVGGCYKINLSVKFLFWIVSCARLQCRLFSQEFWT